MAGTAQQPGIAARSALALLMLGTLHSGAFSCAHATENQRKLAAGNRQNPSTPPEPGAAPQPGANASKEGPNTPLPSDSTPPVHAGVFGGGPFYNEAATVMPMMRVSGFSTVILWTIHVNSNGDLVYNDQLLVSDGKYVGSSAWPAQVASLKYEPTSVKRIEMGVGSADVSDFENIESLIGAQGTGATSILYRNFAALRQTIPAIDAINFDDESNYHVTPTVDFSLMLIGLAYKVTLCPYTQTKFWESVTSRVNARKAGSIDRVYLQLYAGGEGNDPGAWNAHFGGLKVEAGLWSKHDTGCTQGDSPQTVQQKLTGLKSSVSGGWMWLLDDMLACAGQFAVKDYAAAINAALK